MIQSKPLFLMVVLSFTKVTCLCAQPNVTADEKTLAHLKKFRSEYSKSILDKKPEMVQVYYADSVRLMTEFIRTVMGKSNVLMYYKALSASFDIKSYLRNEKEILDLGSMVVEHGMFVMKMISKKTGNEHEVNGKYQNIWKKSGNDKLSLITEGWNYNHRMDIGEQLKFVNMPVVDVALSGHLPVNNNIRFELAALNELLEVTISQHDAKIWSQFYSDDAILFSKGFPLKEGREAIDEYFEEYVKGLPVFEKLDIRNDHIDNLGGFVIEYASHIANWRSGESSGIGVGKEVRIWKRGKDGSLKIYRHIGMYD